MINKLLKFVTLGMNTRFLFRGVEIYEQTKDYVLKRLNRIAKLVDPISEFDIEITQDKKGKYRVEIMVKTPYNLYRAEEITQSVEGSTDIAVDELELQIDKRKTRNRDLKLRGLRSIKKRLILDPLARF